MSRFLSCAAIFLIALAPRTALASSPSPSPSLDTVLQPAPSGYTELTTALLHGEFTAHDWAVNSSPASPTETESTLNTLGFVDGFGKEWSSTSLKRALFEAVMAFSGGRGANNAMKALEKTHRSDPDYIRADTIANMDAYFGAHLVYRGVFEDEFVFVKGNDVFIVLFAGTEDNVLSAAQDQTNAQYNSSPAETIPPWQWPENNGSEVGAFPTVPWVGIGFVVVLVAVVVGVFLNRRQQAPPAMQVGTYAPPPMSGPVQMSPDGNFWWDGQAWQDAAQHVPPGAQRSPDGSLWWDGRTWRPLPQAQPPVR